MIAGIASLRCMVSPRRRGFVERKPDELLEFGAPRVCLIQRRGQCGALLREQRLGVEHVLAGGAAGVELLLPNAQVLLRLTDGGLGGAPRGEPFLGGAVRRPHGSFDVAQLTLDADAILVRGAACRGDLRFAPHVRPHVPCETRKARTDLLWLEHAGARVVYGAAGGEAGKPTALERTETFFQPLLFLEQGDDDRVVSARE